MSTYDNNRRVSLWSKTAKSGTVYLNGNCEIDGTEYWVSLFEGKSNHFGGIRKKGKDGWDDDFKLALTEQEAKSGTTFMKGHIKSTDGKTDLFDITLFYQDVEEGSRAPIVTGVIEELGSSVKDPDVDTPEGDDEDEFEF